MNPTLLKKRIQEAPRMEPTDAVKLVYQSEFGCGHLLGDAQACARRIAHEMESTAVDESTPAAVFIGGGLCRLNLANQSVRRISPDMLARMMDATQKRVQGSMAHFEESLKSLTALAQAGETPFSADALARYLADYRAAGCPPVSHSARYREAYAPAYRVVLSDFEALVPVINEVDARILAQGQALVVLDGDCGAGKTTLSALLSALYNAQPIHMDDFFLPAALRTPERLNQPGGNVHYERFQSEVLSGLKAGGTLQYMRYNCQTGGLEPRRVKPSKLRIIEGSYSHHPQLSAALGELHAIRVFVWADEREQLRRLALRDPKKLARFQAEWIPLEKSYMKAYDIRGRAHIAITTHPWEDA